MRNFLFFVLLFFSFQSFAGVPFFSGSQQALIACTTPAGHSCGTDGFSMFFKSSFFNNFQQIVVYQPVLDPLPDPSFIQTEIFFFGSDCPAGFVLDVPSQMCNMESDTDCTVGETGIRLNLDVSATFLGAVGSTNSFNLNGCSAQFTGCVDGTNDLYRSSTTPGLFRRCDATYTITGVSASTDVVPVDGGAGDVVPVPVDDRVTTSSTDIVDPTVQTNPDGSTTTTTGSTDTQITSAGDSGTSTTITSHNEFTNTNITNTTTTITNAGDVNSNTVITETNSGGGTTTTTVGLDGSISVTSSSDVDNTTTTNINSTIGGDGSGSSETTGGDCVGVGCDGEGGLEEGGFCDFAPTICELADYITAIEVLPDHPDLPVVDANSINLPFNTYQAPSGQCLANPVVLVFGTSVEIPFSETVCVFCELFRPIMAILGCLFGIGILLGGRAQ